MYLPVRSQSCKLTIANSNRNLSNGSQRTSHLYNFIYDCRRHCLWNGQAASAFRPFRKILDSLQDNQPKPNNLFPHTCHHSGTQRRQQRHLGAGRNSSFWHHLWHRQRFFRQSVISQIIKVRDAKPQI